MSEGVEKWAVHNQIIKNIDDLIPYDTDPREHAPKQINQVAKSIQEFGWTMPILIDEKNEIIAGHGRLLAGKQLGFTTVPCIVAEGWTEEQKKAYCIADNKLTENSTWKYDDLKINLEFLNDQGFDLTTTGFSFGELSSILPEFNIDEGKVDEESVPEFSDQIISKMRDIWIVGNHRIMCGDSTEQDHVDQLMNGKLADLVITDPPYNLNYGSHTHEKFRSGQGREIKNDYMSEDEFSLFLNNVFKQMALHSKKGCPTYVFMSAQEWGSNMQRLAGNDYHWSSTIIWNKDRFVLSRKDYNTKYEPIWYGWLNGESRLKGIDNKKESDVWDIQRPHKNDLHPTMKPVEVISRAINNSSEPEDLILDLFGGGGSTLIASQKNKRVNYTMELDPKYVDVIIKRIQEYTGDNAVLEATGELFNDLLK